jgi:hypothetical protein
MPYAYPSTLYYEDQKREHDFYINLGSQRQIAEEKKQALKQVELEKQLLQGYKALRQLELEEQELQRQLQILDEGKKVLEKERKLKHVIWEYNYTKERTGDTSG